MTVSLAKPESGSHFSLLTSPQTGKRTVRSIVILGLSPATVAFARRMAGTEMRLYLVELVTKSRAFQRPRHFFEPQGIVLNWSQIEDGHALRMLRNFAHRVNADALLTADDCALSWLGKVRSHFEPACTVLAPDHAALEWLWDKTRQIRRAVSSGFDVLPNWDLVSAASIDSISSDAFPVVIRPSYPDSAEPRFKARLIRSREELKRFYSSIRWTHPPIAQRFWLGPSYVLHGMRSLTGEFYPWRLFKAYRKYQGVAASLEPVSLPATLECAARQFVQAEGLAGPIHFDLLGDETGGAFHFLEINCRLGGTTGRVVELGYDEPGTLLEAFNLRPPEPLPPLPAHLRTSSLSLNLLQAWNELVNRRDPLAWPQLSRSRAFFSAIREALCVHNSQD